MTTLYDDVQEVLTGRVSFETALVQEDYPYGRSRTERAVWVETVEKGSKKGQQRFMARTRNPKTQRWNKPKASTYSHIIILYLNSDDHVKAAHLSTWDGAEKVAAFVEQFGEYFTDKQRDSVRYIDAVNRVSSRLTWEISTDSNETTEEREERKKGEQKTLNAMLVQELRTPSKPPVLA